MNPFDLCADEVILSENNASCRDFPGDLVLTLTSRRIVMEQIHGLFVKKRQVIGSIPLDTVKHYHGAPQINRDGRRVRVQATAQSLTFVFSDIYEARRFTSKLLEAVTDKRPSDNLVKNAIDFIGAAAENVKETVSRQGVAATVISVGLTTKLVADAVKKAMKK